MQDIVIEPQYLDITIPTGVTFQQPVEPDHTAFVYVFAGDGFFDEQKKTRIHLETLVLFDAGESIVAEAGENGLRFILVSGKPLNEPVAWQGPIVMNTQQELETAFREFHEGSFIKQTDKD